MIIDGDGSRAALAPSEAPAFGPRRGRPAGPTTPEDLLRREMRETAALASKVRSLIERVLTAMQRKMDSPSTTTEQTIAMGEALANLLPPLTRNAEACGKLLMRDSAPRADSDEATTDDILRELSGKKK